MLLTQQPLCPFQALRHLRLSQRTPPGSELKAPRFGRTIVKAIGREHSVDHVSIERAPSAGIGGCLRALSDHVAVRRFHFTPLQGHCAASNGEPLGLGQLFWPTLPGLALPRVPLLVSIHLREKLGHCLACGMATTTQSNLQRHPLIIGTVVALLLHDGSESP